MNRPTNRKQQNKKTSAALAVSLILILSLMLFTIMSFVSFDQASNRFRTAALDISLHETNFDRLSERDKTTLIPNKTLPKDPKVQNTDETDAFVFLKVTMPVYYVTKVADDGTKPEAQQRQDAFFLKTEANQNAAATDFNTVGASDEEHWVELPGCETGTDYQSNIRTYVFGYNVYVRRGEMTETLFDYIEFKNLIQYEIDPKESMNVQVKAYGIQADFLNDIQKGTDSQNAIMTEEQLTQIYRLIGSNQEQGG